MVEEVAPGVYFCRGTEVNWYLLRDGDDVTLIDTGYPGDVRAVLLSWKWLAAPMWSTCAW